LGKGDGTFQDQLRYPSSSSGELGITGDFNGDGRADIIGSGQFATGIALVLGKGDGTFSGRALFAKDEGPADGVAVDFNGDGHLDLVVSNAASNDISILLGKGKGKFAAQMRFVVGDGPTPRRGLEAGDFNGDGWIDLAIPQVISNDIAILLGTGDGRFGA